MEPWVLRSGPAGRDGGRYRGFGRSFDSSRKARLMKKLIVVSASLVILALMTAEAFGRG